MNARSLLILLLASAGNPAFAATATTTTTTTAAATAPAPAPAVGQSTLKLAPPENPVRMARKELASVEQNIKELDARILTARTQAITARATRGTNSTEAASFQALSEGLATERAQLVSKRSE